MSSKKQILSAIAAIGRKLGHTPSRHQFPSLSGITEYSVSQCFPTWNDAVRAAGLRPYTLNARTEDEALLEDWGKAVRRNRGVPTVRAYRLEGKYNPRTIEKRFGRWSSLPHVFRDFAKGKRKWADVLTYLPAQAPKKETARPKENPGSPILPGQAPHPPLEGRAT